MRAWAVIVTIGAGTWALRSSLVLLFGRVEVPRILERAFRYVGPAVLAAIAVPAFVAPGGDLDPVSLRLPAAVVAGLVAWRWHSVPWTLIAGLGTFAALSLLT